MNEQNKNSETCIVCLEYSDTTLSVLDHLKKNCQCNYSIHKDCIDTWVKKESVCPICKNKLVYIDPTVTTYISINSEVVPQTESQCCFFLYNIVYLMVPLSIIGIIFVIEKSISL